MLKKMLSAWQTKKNRLEEQEFYSDVNAANLYGLPVKCHLILWLSLIFFITFILWAHYAKIDEVTRGRGKIIPSSHIQVIQNLEGGILADILVNEGDLVEKDQALLQLDDVRFASSFNETKLKYYEQLATIARLTAEVNQEAITIPDEVVTNYSQIADDAIRLFKSRKNEKQANQSILEEQIRQKKQDLIELRSNAQKLSRSYSLLKKELEMSKPLVEAGALSRVEILRLQRNANDLQGELTAARLSMPRLESSIDEAKNKLSELDIRFKTEALEKLNSTKAELERTNEMILALEDRVTRTRIISPVKGTIKLIRVKTIGGVVQPGMDLLEIVPLEDQLLVEAQIRPADIAFIRPEQKGIVKLTAYDFSIYGGLEAKLEHISADTIVNKEDDQSYYLVRLRTNKNYLEKNGEKLNIISGMTADVDILTGKKSVLDYILKPILKARESALKER